MRERGSSHREKSKIENRLIGKLDPDEWELPPKPKWMRWKTYNRHVERFDRYEEILDRGMEELVRMAMKLGLLEVNEAIRVTQQISIQNKVRLEPTS